MPRDARYRQNQRLGRLLQPPQHLSQKHLSRKLPSLLLKHLLQKPLSRLLLQFQLLRLLRKLQNQLLRLLLLRKPLSQLQHRSQWLQLQNQHRRLL